MLEVSFKNISPGKIRYQLFSLREQDVPKQSNCQAVKTQGNALLPYEGCKGRKRFRIDI